MAHGDTAVSLGKKENGIQAVTELSQDTYKVKQEVPAHDIVLDQMGGDVCESVGSKGHQKIRSCYCQGATCGRKKAKRL